MTSHANQHVTSRTKCHTVVVLKVTHVFQHLYKSYMVSKSSIKHVLTGKIVPIINRDCAKTIV